MLKVMIVDDEQLIVKGMKTIIERRSSRYSVVGEALGGEEALRIAQKCRPDLVITDICMPDIGGLELIGKLKELLPEAKFVVLSGYGEFSYAQEALRLGVSDYLLKPVNGKKIYELLEKITDELEASERLAFEEEKRRLRDSLYQLLYLEKRSEEPYVRNCLEPGKYYTVDLITYPGNMGEEEKQRWISVTENYFAKNKKGVVTSEGGETAAVVQAKTASDVHLINRCLLDQLVPGGIRIFVSSTGTDRSDIACLFRQARQCREMAFYRKSKERIVLWKGEEVRPLTIDLINHDVTSLIARGLKEGRKSEAAERYRSLLDQYEEMMIQPCDVVRLIQGTLRIVINQLVEEGVISPVIDEMLDEQIYHINSCREREELLNGIDSILDALSGECGGYDGSSTSKIIYEVKKYIQNHYQEDITLAALADRVFISPKYLSDLFKKETGDTYTSYLISVRMEHAKQLLGQLNYKIYEIAGLVGYPNPKHFIKAFKKEVGMTPGEYRNRGTFYGK